MLLFLRSCKIIFFIFFIIILSISFSVTNSYSQENGIRFEHVSNSEGRFPGSIFYIVQDYRGFIWYGGDYSIKRFDGYTVKDYSVIYPSDSMSVPIGNNSFMFEDRKKNLWIGTNNRGLLRYHREADKFKVYSNEQENPNSLSNNCLTAIFEDKNGGLWIGTGNGLNRYSGKTEKFERYLYRSAISKKVKKNNITVIGEDSYGYLWIGTSRGVIYKFDKKTERFTEYKNEPKNPNSFGGGSIRAIHEDKRGSLWISSFGGGLYRYNRNSDDFHIYKNEPGNPNSLSINDLTLIYEDKYENLWFGTEGGGLNRYNRDTDDFTVYRNDPGKPNSFSGTFVKSICEDNSGSLWIGTYDSGLSRYNRDTNDFTVFKSKPDNKNSLSSNIIFSIFKDNTGNLWIGTFGNLNKLISAERRFTGVQNSPNFFDSLSSNIVYSIYKEKSDFLWVGTFGGLNRFDLKKNDLTLFKNKSGSKNSLSNNRILAIKKSRKNILWLGTAAGLCKYDIITKRIKNYNQIFDKELTKHKKNFIRIIYEDKNGLLWLGTNAGITIFNPETELFVTPEHELTGISDNLSGQIINTFCEDKTGSLWIGTQDNGLRKLNMNSGEYTAFNHEPGNPGSLIDNMIRAIYVDNSGLLWLGSEGGLSVFDPAKENFRHFTNSEAFVIKSVYDIFEGDSGNLWLSTTGGIVKAKKTYYTNNQKSFSIKFKNYSTSNNLAGRIFPGSSFKSEDGEIYVGGSNGFFKFKLDNFQEKNKHIPPVVITDLKIYNRSVSVGESINQYVILNKSISETKEIELSYKNNYLTFVFAALDFLNPDENEYSYMVEGLNSNWINIGNKTSVDLNLTSGDYVFKLKGSNNDKLWNEDGASIKIKVIPPFWDTIWFKGLSFLSFSGIIVIFIFWRMNDLRRRNINLEKIVSERTNELKLKLLHIKKLEGILPICSNCKKIRLKKSNSKRQKNWIQIEKYISDRTNADFSHGICPECIKELYPDFEK